ncbi:unnamed protein product [Parnassius mnemosyne]|uniref:Nose resistant-to-fluoxetine protein N-terminal domain-containing protein n=1 Tax=Parnassius mnemosyne TaxID=213953 RepID=A0AAV1LYP9_9NEOP
MAAKLGIVFFFFLAMVSSARSFGHNMGYSKKESHLKSRKSPRTRGDIFENLFVIYDPSFLSLVWPRIMNGVHVNIDWGCWDDLSVFYNALFEGRAWAYSAVDASGRYQPGMFQGTRLWLGSKELCFRLDNEFVTRRKFSDGNSLVRREKDFNEHEEDWSTFTVKEALTQSTAVPDETPLHRLAYISAQVSLNITKFKIPKSYEITLGLCLPRSCSPDDVASLLNFSIMLNDNLKTNGTTPRAVKIISLRQIEEYYDIRYDAGAVLLIFFTLLLITLAVIATIVDVGLDKCLKNHSGPISLDLHKYNADSSSSDDQSRKYNCEVVKVFVDLKREKILDKETLKINKDLSKNLNSETIKKLAKVTEIPPAITLDIMAPERQIASCKRCGKYKKQRGISKRFDNIPACPRTKYNNCASLTNTEYRQKHNIFLNLLLSFSLKHNWKKIFNTTMANKDIALVHLLRIVSTFWVIFIHVTTIVGYLSENYNDTNGSEGKYYVLRTGTLAFDALFFVSGMFSAHHFFYLSNRYTVRELVSCGGQSGKILQFVCFVTNRAIRLLPPYIYTVFLTAVFARVLRDTASAMLPEGDYYNCDTYWWRNILYITLFYPENEQCMQVSWYLSTDTLLHACGALLCVLMTSPRRRSALMLLTAAILAATAFDVIKAFSDYNKRFHGIFEGYLLFIQRPVARVAPYFIGVLSGWLVHKLDGRTRVPRLVSCCLWLLSAAVLVASVSVSALYGHWSCSWLHLAWPAALLWPALVSSTDYAGQTRRILDSGVVAALSRLTYCAMLLHGPVARWLLLTAGNAFCANTVCLWIYCAGTSLMTVVGALLLSLLVEMPCCCLIRRISDYAYS